MNTITIDGRINGGIAHKVSAHSGRPDANFTILIESENKPPFYFRCYAEGPICKEIEPIKKGDLVRITGSLETTVLCDNSYDKQIRVYEIQKL